MRIKGEIHLKVFENGKLVQEYKVKNLVVDGGKDGVARLIGNDDPAKYINQIGVGTGSSAPVAGDATLTSLFKKAVDSVSFPATNKVTFNWTISLAEANGLTIAEFGLFMSDDTMFARRLALTPIVKNNTISLSGAWTISF